MFDLVNGLIRETCRSAPIRPASWHLGSERRDVIFQRWPRVEITFHFWVSGGAATLKHTINMAKAPAKDLAQWLDKMQETIRFMCALDSLQSKVAANELQVANALIETDRACHDSSG